MSNTFLIDMSAAAAALGEQTSTYAATSTLAVPGLAIGFAAAIAFAQDETPRTSAETAGLLRGGTIIISGHAQELSIDFPVGATPMALDVSMTSVSAHGGGNILGEYALPDVGGLSLHGLF